jgi:haloalkane dehalogenase
MSVPFEVREPPVAVRTHDARFADLPDFPFAPKYAELTNPYADIPLRMHYVDEGPPDAPVVLMVHGEPTWSYLYRKLIPVFVSAGLRAIAVDQIGFGRSDKLTRPAHYSFAAHVDWFREFITALSLRDITLVCQDWGGPIALAVLAREPARFSRVVAGNTMLHTAGAELEGRLEWAAHANNEREATVSTPLLDWMHHTHRALDFRASSAVAATSLRGVDEATLAAYDAPFPSEWHKAGMRQFPALIPVTPSDPGAAINRDTWTALADFDRPFLTLFSDSDPGTRGWEAIFRERVPGAKDQPHQLLERAGHFWQEECGEHAAKIIVDWISRQV